MMNPIERIEGEGPNARCGRCGMPLSASNGLCLACLLDAGLSDEPRQGLETPETGPVRSVRRVGDYDLLEEIARGGMGVVYKARQRSLGRIVAFKTIRAGHLATPQDVARFRLEAEAVANLKHPNIVAIHEVGDAAGQHFFSMDYIEGQNLSNVVREGPLVAEQAARYVEKIARAVQYAHQHGVLHRDLKPSNVLLDAQNELHLTDFGVAKRLDSETDLTLSGQVLGTPSFMPPEQAGNHRYQIGPRSDVYSLGAILYHLVTGRPPFVGPDVHTILKQLTETDVITPRLLNPSIPRDLETIALKCLEKNPDRRYHTALDLAQDLARYLNHEPIAALPPSAAYRVKKFVRRHWRPVAAVAGFVLLLTVATVVSAIFGVRANRERAKAVSAEGDARTVLEFLQDKVLAAARPLGDAGGLGRDATLRAALDAAEPTVAKRFARRPKVEAEIRNGLGLTYHYLGDDALAVPQLERALELRRITPGLGETNALYVMFSLSEMYRALGRHADALRLLERLLQLQNRNSGGITNFETLRIMNQMAATQVSAGQLTNAIALLETVMAWQEAVPKEEEIIIIDAMNTMAGAFEQRKRFSEALSLRHKVLAGYSRLLGKDHRKTRIAMNNLAKSLFHAGDKKEAEDLYRKLIERLEFILGRDHPQTLEAMDNLGGVLAGTGRLEEGIALREEVHKLSLAKLGPDHIDTLIAANNLAMDYRDVGRSTNAEPLLEDVVRRAKVKLGSDHPDTLQWMHNLFQIYQKVGKYTNAASILAEEVSFLKTTKGLDDSWTQEELLVLGQLHLRILENFDEAEWLLEELMNTVRRSLPNPRFGSTLASLGEAKMRVNKPAEAETLLREAYRIEEQQNPWKAILAQRLLGLSLQRQKKYAEAEPLLRRSYEKLYAPNPQDLLKKALKETAESLAEIYEALGSSDEAGAWREKAASLRRSPPRTSAAPN